MFKLISRLLGENPEYTRYFQPGSKRKIVMFSILLILPVILWFIAPYLLITDILKGSRGDAIIAGIVASIIIFIIDRAIILSNGNRRIRQFRMILGFTTAFLGAIIFDEILFKTDIDHQIALDKSEYVHERAENSGKMFQNEIDAQKLAVKKSFSDWQNALLEAVKEADGTGGSGSKSVGSITKLKMDVANRFETNYLIEISKLESMNAQQKAAIEGEKIKAVDDFKENALLIRINALFKLVFSNLGMFLVYLAFTVVLFCVECIVIIMKSYTDDSVDERLEKLREKIILERAIEAANRDKEIMRPERKPILLQQVKTEVNRKVLNY